jgi:hypothetical protein
MHHSVIAAGVAAIALAFASPAAAGSAHHPAKRAPTAERCAVPTRAEALTAPLASDRALQAKIDQLTGVISTLSDRLASLEEKLGSSADKDDPDADDDSAGDEMSLASAHRAGRAGLHRHRPSAASPEMPAA